MRSVDRRGIEDFLFENVYGLEKQKAQGCPIYGTLRLPNGE